MSIWTKPARARVRIRVTVRRVSRGGESRRENEVKSCRPTNSWRVSPKAATSSVPSVRGSK